MGKSSSKRKAEGPVYPDISVKLIGEPGDAKSVLEKCEAAMRDSGLNDEAVTEFLNEAQSGDYNKLLATCVRYFEVQ